MQFILRKQSMQIEFEGSTLSMKKILPALVKYKWINTLIFITTIALGVLYYLLSQPIYQSSATIEISTTPQENRVDFFGNSIGRAHGTETEIDILKSEFLLNKTLYTLDRSVEYFEKKGIKSTLLYKERPFSVTDVKINDEKAFGKRFYIKYIDQNRFEIIPSAPFYLDLLTLIPKEWLPSSLHLIEGKTYQYGDVVTYENCSFIVHKNGRFQKAEYSFKLNSYEAVLEGIRKNLTIKPASLQSSVLKVTYKDNIAARAKDFLNTYVDHYLQYSKRNLIETDAKTLTFINEQLDLVKGKLKYSEDSLQGYKKSNNISDIQAQKIETIGKLSEFQEAQKRAEINFRIIEKLYLEVKRGNYNSISSVGTEYPVLNTMLQNLEDTKLERENKLTLLTNSHPDMISLNNGIKNLESAIIAMTKGIYDKSKEEVASLRKIVEEYTLKVKSLPEIEKELVKHERIYTVNDKVYNYLLQKQSELSIEKAATPLNKKVLDYAKAPIKPLSPKLGAVIPISVFLGLIFALLHTALRVKFDTKIKDRSDIHSVTDIPIFGMIPFVRNTQKYNTAYVLDAPNSTASEAFRTVKNNLEYAVTENKCKVVLVTSSVPNEGKTTISANLSAVLGMGEKRCVILSLDLRRPELHHKFMLSNKLGMSDVLSQKVHLKDVIWENENYPNFNIITSGSIPPNPAELLASSRMKEILDTLSESYDYIILDTPPFEYVGDALNLIKYADVTLFVVKSEFSEYKNLKEIDKLSKRLGIENAGIILNSVKAKHYANRKFDYRYIYHEA